MRAPYKLQQYFLAENDHAVTVKLAIIYTQYKSV